VSTPKKSVVFRLEPRVNEYLGEDARVSGEFAGVLPRAKCPKCGEVAADSFAEYPCITIDQCGDEHRLRTIRTVFLRTFRAISRDICARLGKRVNLLPGGQLGPYTRAKADKLKYDVEWCEPWRPLFRLPLLKALKSRGIAIDHAPVKIEVRNCPNLEYALLQGQVHTLMARKMVKMCLYKICDECGEAQVTDPWAPPVRRVYLDRRGMTLGSHLFRVVNASGFLLVSDTLAKALRELRPSGLRLIEAGVWV
jgi:hypothetical protein